MSGLLWLLPVGLLTAIAYLGVCWLFDIGCVHGTDIGFREWWRNRPVKEDPDRWDRLLKQRRAPRRAGLHEPPD